MTCNVIQTAAGICQKARYEMRVRSKTAADVNIIAAPGLGSARIQQQTGQDRCQGGSPVSQRMPGNESDHDSPADRYCHGTGRRPGSGEKRLYFKQNTHGAGALQGKNARISNLLTVCRRRRPHRRGIPPAMPARSG